MANCRPSDGFLINVFIDFRDAFEVIEALLERVDGFGGELLAALGDDFVPSLVAFHRLYRRSQ